MLFLGSTEEGVVTLVRVDRPDVERPDTEECPDTVDEMDSLESRRTSACDPREGRGGGPALGRRDGAS